ncbi:MAG: hypothetical protein JOY60_07005 [Burkholderiaceae bacterium]|nr:hypothetical protein [Roseateles sp.]MBV8469593.1 hypothetical protein [Burkholderiaceae bacterium]
MRRIRRVYVEDSNTPIYRRIAYALGAEFGRCGIEVALVNPEAFDTKTYLELLKGGRSAVYVANAGSNLIQQRVPGQDNYFFERFAGRVVFLHQDTLLGGLGVLEGVAKLTAWIRMAERSIHLCIEPSCITALQQLGIAHVHWVPHASETPLTNPQTSEFHCDASFVGHVMPSRHRARHHAPRLQQFIDACLTLRRLDFSQSLHERVKAHVDGALEGIGTPVDRTLLGISQQEWVRTQISLQTMTERGWLLESAALPSLDIFGGDPAYLHGVARREALQVAGVRTHDPVYEPRDIQRVFRGSRVNINYSSLQFDHAVVNRFHDITMAGGLCLTDARSGLAELTDRHEEVSFRNVDELRDKVAYFSKPANMKKRVLLIKLLQADVQNRSGYPLLVRKAMEALAALP